jgi:hypothetical protein
MFTKAKPLDGIQVPSLKTLSIYDCRDARSALIGFVAYRDREASEIGAQSLRYEANAEFGPLPDDGGGMSGALRKWACARMPAR